jgi:hypothetical protein
MTARERLLNCVASIVYHADNMTRLCNGIVDETALPDSVLAASFGMMKTDLTIAMGALAGAIDDCVAEDTNGN